MAVTKAVVIGFDGLEPRILEPMLRAGRLPNFARVAELGGYSRVATTTPAQTPVAWSTFATGVNPGRHGVFDFVGRDPVTYLPQFGLNRYEQKNPFVPPRAVNRRRGQTIWGHLSEAGIESVVLRCPCTYPPDPLRGRLLAGLGVPDLRGSYGVSSFYTSGDGLAEGEDETVLRVAPDVAGRIETTLLGPLDAKTRKPVATPIRVSLHPESGEARIHAPTSKRHVAVRQGRWSDWLPVKFKMGMMRSVWGMVRFHLVRLEPCFELYASPVNFLPGEPPFPISSPPGYAADLADRVGTFYTAGMVEDHGGLENGRLDDAAFLDQVEQVWKERETMMLEELGSVKGGLFFCLFDTPDRVQHMFWRTREPVDNGADGNGEPSDFGVIRQQYLRCDAVLEKAMELVDEQTLLVVLSDHGFGAFDRGVHLNAWLHEQGLLHLKGDVRPGPEAGNFFRHVDWSRTKAYALGLVGIYLNRRGREGQGIVDDDEARRLVERIKGQLGPLRDERRGRPAIRRVVAREEVYRGELVGEAPDVIVNFDAGYRVSWETALGGVPEGTFADNTRRWSGDHIVDPALVPGVLLMNRPFDRGQPRLLDMAPTILQALGSPLDTELEGESLLT